MTIIRTAVLIAAYILMLAAPPAAASAAPTPRPLDGYAKTDGGKVKLLLLPSHFMVYQLGASGVTSHEIPEWSRAAEQHASGALRAFLDLSSEFAAVELPPLSDEQTAALDEHLGLAELLAFNAWSNRMTGGSAWKHKQKQFDQEIGPGLRYLRERTGADVAVFAVGMDAYSTGGRIAMGVMTTLVFGVTPVAFPSIVVIAMVELETGRVVYANLGHGGTDLRVAERVYEYVDRALCEYPRSQLLGHRTKDCKRDWEVAPDGTMFVEQKRTKR